MPKFSANLGFLWPGLPLTDRIAAAARAGFKAVELHFPYDHDPKAIAAACSDNGVALLGINTALGDRPGDSGLAAVPGREGDARIVIDQALEFAAAADGTSVHVMAGKVPSDQKAAARKVFVTALDYAARRAGRLNLKILMEPINQRDMPGCFYSTIEEAADLIDEIGSDHLRIMFDCYQVGVSQGDVITRLRKYLAKIGHVQIAAVPSRAEPNTGELAYTAIFRELDDLGYGDWVGCEYRPRGDTDEGLAWIRDLGVRLTPPEVIVP